MELQTAIEILEYHQEWRLGKREDMIHEPKKLTEALDIVISEVKENRIGSVISRFFSELALKHNVKIDDLNLHISNKTLYIQEYTPGGLAEYSCLEMIDLNGL